MAPAFIWSISLLTLGALVVAQDQCTANAPVNVSSYGSCESRVCCYEATAGYDNLAEYCEIDRYGNLTYIGFITNAASLSGPAIEPTSPSQYAYACGIDVADSGILPNITAPLSPDEYGSVAFQFESFSYACGAPNTQTAIDCTIVASFTSKFLGQVTDVVLNYTAPTDTSDALMEQYSPGYVQSYISWVTFNATDVDGNQVDLYLDDFGYEFLTTAGGGFNC